MRVARLLRRPVLIPVLVVLLAAGGWYVRSRFLPREQPPNPFDLPPLSASPFLNTSPEVSYVGVKVCAECHKGKHRTWQYTPHSKALGDLNLADEPADAQFVHAASGQTNSIYRDHGQMHHRSAARDEHGEFVVEDHVIRFLVGSGHHTRSYLVEDDGFLSESPLTWYTSRKAWGMSPGYDRPNHRGFERATDSSCLFCHVGRISAPDSSYQRMTFLEQPIGCERCHGPGELHVTEERAIKAGSKSKQDRRQTIVHPAKLDRARNEAICSQCHLNADSAVVLRGRSMSDFRPGLPLSDFCVSYRLDTPSSQMKVVGHVDQLHLSPCYQKSEDLTCTTCHDPHASSGPKEARQRSRQTCIGCHGKEGCKLPSHKRLERSPTNDCLVCHMPQVDTEIQHVAFTHHRIGVHSGKKYSSGTSSRLPSLVVLEEPPLSALDRDRNLGLAYFSLAQRQTDAEAVTVYQERATRLLEETRKRGLPDGEAAAALARLCRRSKPEKALGLARAALDDARLSPKARINALFLTAEVSLNAGRLREAQQALEKLTSLRRLSQDWLLLGLCRQGSGDLAGAQRDLEKAISIAPFRPDLREHLARIHEQRGNHEAARREQSIAARLRSLTSSAR